MLSEVIASF